MTKKDKDHNLRAFKQHGVLFVDRTGNQAVGHCVFCNKEGKFYVNMDNQLWDCKVCGEKGNLQTFLEKINELNVSHIDRDYLKKLATNRGLPVSALSSWEFGKMRGGYTLAIRNHKGAIQDLRIISIGKPIRGTSGCGVGLLGLNTLAKSNPSEPVYVCEGEWDAIAMEWLLKKLKKPGVVVGVPGASTFKREWTQYFGRRNVYTFYDKDPAGDNGELVARDRLQAIAKDIRFIDWPENVHMGFDLRDWIIEGAIKRKIPRKCYGALMELLRPYPRTHSGEESREDKPLITKSGKPKKVTLAEVCEVFSKHLYLPSYEAIEFIATAIISNAFHTDPVWAFIVAPPGGCKSELLRAWTTHEYTMSVSSLTPNALISGANVKDGVDPSFIPKWDGKVVINKDFTTITSKRDTEMDEIFGILRDAYDGECCKIFGTGQKKEYFSHFTFIAGVTPSIYELGSKHQSLGERFIKFCIGENINHINEREIIRQAIDNVKVDNNMRKELAEICNRFLDYMLYKVQKMKDDKKDFDPIEPKLKEKIISLAMFAARCRGTVSKADRENDIIMGRPYSEFGTRLGKQFTHIAQTNMLIHEDREVGERQYRLLKKIALDTISQRYEDILRTMLVNCPTIDDTMRTIAIANHTCYTTSTVGRMLNDMRLLDIVTRTGSSTVAEWTLSKYIRNLIQEAELYTTVGEKEREVPELRIKKKRKKKSKSKPRKVRKKS